MTESELLASPSFLKWCAIWEKDRHCPLPMADWALENVGELAFEACVWAHETEERDGSHDGNVTLRVAPKYSQDRRLWFWTTVSGKNYHCCVPVPMGSGYFQTFPAAIAYYLTHFDRALVKKYPPKVLEAV